MHIYLSKRALSYIAVAITLFFLTFTFSTPTFAAESTSNVVETNLFGNVEDDGSGCGVFMILNLVLNILSGGVGVAGLIGISIVGIRYLTSAGNEEQARTSRHRMFQIIIGLAVFAVMYAITSFLLPGGTLNTSSTCKTISTEELNKRRAAENAAKQSSSSNNKKSSSSASKSSSSTKKNNASKTDLEKWYDAIEWAANYMKKAKYGDTGGKCGNNYKSNFKCAETNGTCVTYVSIALQKAGLIPKNTHIYFGKDGKISGKASAIKALQNNKKISISYPNKTVKELYKKDKIKKGDIVAYQYNSGTFNGHIMIFMGFKKGKPIFHTFGHKGMKKNNAHGDGSKKVTMLIHFKYQ